MIHCETESTGHFRAVLRVDEHELHADIPSASGGESSAPGPHDYFDASLAACKALTASLYAKQKGIPLEHVEIHVDRDSSREREGVYTLKVRVAFRGPLDEAQKQRLYNVVARCPIHKLMTATEVIVETAPLAP
jgi:putative redox protein